MKEILQIHFFGGRNAEKAAINEVEGGVNGEFQFAESANGGRKAKGFLRLFLRQLNFWEERDTPFSNSRWERRRQL